jgi:UDP-glucuronate decarboxylase
MKILVTGGAGFIGSHLIQHLMDQGHQVVCLDNFWTGSLDNISAFLHKPGFQMWRGDVAEVPYAEVDEIYNLACPASPKGYQSNPVATGRTSVLGALNMLELAMSRDIKILQASTSEVYGDPLQHPQREDYWGNVNPVGPRSCYDEGKRFAETAFTDYHRQYGTKIRIARIFNTYGPGMQPDDGRVVPSFILKALRGEDLVIYGDGRHTRSFCYVEDTAVGLIALMNSEVTSPVNIGNPQEMSILDLATEVIRLTNSKSKIVHADQALDDPHRRQPVIVKARTLLGWGPSVDLQQGLQDTISYFKRFV